MKRYLITILIFGLFPFLCYTQEVNNNNQLALLYYSQKEYSKAADIYLTLYNENHSQIYFDYLISCYKELNETEKAEKIIQEQIKRYPQSFYYQVKLALLYSYSGKNKEANNIYEKIIKKASKQLNDCISAGQACIDNKIDSVAKIIYENGIEKYPDNIIITKNLSEIYLHLGENEKLTNTYITLLKEHYEELEFIKSQLQYTLYEKTNPQLKQCLLSKLSVLAEKDRKPFAISELYLWIYIQDKDFENAFSISQNIDKQNDEDGERLFDLGEIALTNNDYNCATNCFYYVVQKGKYTDLYDVALKNLLKTSYNKLFYSGTIPNKQQILKLKEEYRKALNDVTEDEISAELIKNLAHIQAFYLNSADSAITILQKSIESPNYKSYKSDLETELANIQLFAGNIWDANMIFASIALQYKNKDIGHAAQLQQARIAYYNGNFAYAQILLDVLKSSTSKLIANDAFELSQLISDNTALDTSTTALSLFAKGDLYIFQGKKDLAISSLDSISLLFPGHSLEDDILFRKAEIAKAENDTTKMIDYLLKLENKFPYEIFTAKAIFTLAEFYDNNNQPLKAKEKYKKLLSNYPNSFYSAVARKRYRELLKTN